MLGISCDTASWPTWERDDWKACTDFSTLAGVPTTNLPARLAPLGLLLHPIPRPALLRLRTLAYWNKHATRQFHVISSQIIQWLFLKTTYLSIWRNECLTTPPAQNESEYLAIFKYLSVCLSDVFVSVCKFCNFNHFTIMAENHPL